MEAMMYLTPILIILAFGFYLIVLALLKLPTKIFDLSQFLKISLFILIAWTFLVAMILFEDQVNPFDFSTLKIGIAMYLAMLPILVLGCMSANSCYLVMYKNSRAKYLYR
jgi:hypothetical protein